MDATLVDRSTRHLSLTDAGTLFRPYALRILGDVEEAGTALDGFAGVPRGTLQVSAPFTFSVALGPIKNDTLAPERLVRSVFCNGALRVRNARRVSFNFTTIAPRVILYAIYHEGECR